MTPAQKLDQKEAIKELKKVLKKGKTVYTVLRHVSRSGMQRHISLILPPKPGSTYMRHLDHNAARALGWQDSGKGIVVGGCGLDTGHHLVYSLSHRLFSDGYALKQQWI